MSSDLDRQLHVFAADCYADPLAFVLGAWNWPIDGEPGPDAWQRDTLIEVGEQVAARGFDGHNAVLPIREAISSGHGIGKSVLIAWLTIWLMSTRRNALGTITANTNEQLEKKTWAAIRKWLATCLYARWFEVNGEILYRKGYRASWFCAPQSCAEENSEAFAGQHAKASSSFYFFDEASAVPDKIWEVAEGGLTDGEPFIFAFGNPTRNTGKFHQVVFGSLSHRWKTHIIDSRTCKFSNKELIAQWLEDVGGNEDDDFIKVRVRGLPPSADENQFIDLARVMGARKRVVSNIGDEPTIYGVDVSGGGSAWTVAAKRKGLDARFPRTRISGEASRDRTHVVSVLAQLLDSESVDAMFVDAAFGAAVVERLRALGHRQVHEVNFGGPSLDTSCANLRAYMWKSLKEWLARGGIEDGITDKGDRFMQQLRGPGYHLNKSNKLVIEAKESMQKRGVSSPDDADALALTFAQPVRKQERPAMVPARLMPTGPGSWMG